jgi:uncharacterized protein with FMN-binding domain
VVRRGDQTGTRRNAAVFLATAAVTGLLLRYPTSTHGSMAQPAVASVAGPPAAETPPTGPTAPTKTAPTTTAPTKTAPGAVQTVDGPAVETGYGPIQVRLTVRGGRILTATATDFPESAGPSRSINHRAVPVLQAETVSAQSAQIDAVSGATYTSAGYVSSLQAALDAAQLR